MPKIPSTNYQTLNAPGARIADFVRATASGAYQDRIPEATQTSLANVWQALDDWEPGKNEFLNNLVNRIGKVWIQSKEYTNPLRPLKKGYMEFGETVEEIFVNIIQAKQFDPQKAENEVFKREIPDVRSAFHKMNYQNFYKATISNEQLRQAFLSDQGIMDLVSRIIEQMYSSAEYDEFLIMKNLFVEAANKGMLSVINVPEVTDEASAKTLLRSIRAAGNNLSFMSDKYNSAGVTTYTRKSELVLFILSEIDAYLDVEALAYAFNMSKADIEQRKILVDNFGGLEEQGVVAILADESFMMCFDNWQGFTYIYNPDGLYWNYDYHRWATYSLSPFSNVVAFSTVQPTIEGVTISPTTANTTENNTAKFTATVNGTGVYDTSVTWSIEGDHPAVTVDNTGLVTVTTTTDTTVNIIATANGDTSKTATATLKILHPTA